VSCRENEVRVFTGSVKSKSDTMEKFSISVRKITTEISTVEVEALHINEVKDLVVKMVQEGKVAFSNGPSPYLDMEIARIEPDRFDFSSARLGYVLVPY